MISRRVDNIAYELELPSDVAEVHPVFHVSTIKKCLEDHLFTVPSENIYFKENLYYTKISIHILDHQDRN